jgi:hypothetical protein
MMNSARLLLVAAVVVFSSQAGSAQDLSRYRGYVLESSLESVVAASGARAADTKTLHKRPATIQELEWLAPYVSSGSQMADPVRGAVFGFFNGALYRIVVRYERDRTDGLTNADVIESLTGIYGEPLAKAASNRASIVLPDTVLLAQWDSPESSLALLRGTYSAEFQLLIVSKALSTRARDAIRESDRLDAMEAPRRELERRKQEVADVNAARAKSRSENKAAFRP